MRGAEDIVRRLAAIADPTVEDRDYTPSAECGLCRVGDDKAYRHNLDDPAKHDADCPWRLAREWVEAAGQQGKLQEA